MVTIENHCIVERGYQQSMNKAYEGLMAQGNGYLHVRASFEEGLTDAPQNEVYWRKLTSVLTEKPRSPSVVQGGDLRAAYHGADPLLDECVVNLPN